jgi:hypothetical protein
MIYIREYSNDGAKTWHIGNTQDLTPENLQRLRDTGATHVAIRRHGQYRIDMAIGIRALVKHEFFTTEEAGKHVVYRDAGDKGVEVASYPTAYDALEILAALENKEWEVAEGQYLQEPERQGAES